MKNTLKTALLAAAMAGVATAAQAASYPNTDLIIGFTLQSGNDLMFDLGTAGSLVSGETWNLNSLLGGLNSSSVKWGVVGSDSFSEVAYTTKATGTPSAISETQWGNVDTAVQSIYSLFPGSGGPATSTAPSSTLANSWNQQTIAGPGTTTYHNAIGFNPNQTGYSSINFFSIDGANGTPASLLGTFSFANDGVVTFNATAVPEPSVYGLAAGMGVLVFCLRNQFRRKQA